MSDNTFVPGLLRVIHPLDDEPEQKLYRADLGSMRITPVVRLSLLMPRGYLAAMVMLVGWRVLSGM